MLKQLMTENLNEVKPKQEELPKGTVLKSLAAILAILASLISALVIVNVSDQIVVTIIAILIFIASILVLFYLSPSDRKQN
jgi:uncharacterized membrane protein YkgB